LSQFSVGRIVKQLDGCGDPGIDLCAGDLLQNGCFSVTGIEKGIEFSLREQYRPGETFPVQPGDLLHEFPDSTGFIGDFRSVFYEAVCIQIVYLSGAFSFFDRTVGEGCHIVFSARFKGKFRQTFIGAAADNFLVVTVSDPGRFGKQCQTDRIQDRRFSASGTSGDRKEPGSIVRSGEVDLPRAVKTVDIFDKQFPDLHSAFSSRSVIRSVSSARRKASSSSFCSSSGICC